MLALAGKKVRKKDEKNLVLFAFLQPLADRRGRGACDLAEQAVKR